MKTTLLMRLMLRLVRGDTERALLEAVDYLVAESRVLKKRYEQDCGRRLLLSNNNAGNWPHVPVRWSRPDTHT